MSKENSSYNTEKHKDGKEYFDDTPSSLSIGLKRPESLNEMVRRLCHNEMSLISQGQGKESFEEADDFNIGDPDDELGMSGYQLTQMQEEFFEPLKEVSHVGSENKNDTAVGSEGRVSVSTDNPGKGGNEGTKSAEADRGARPGRRSTDR